MDNNIIYIKEHLKKKKEQKELALGILKMSSALRKKDLEKIDAIIKLIKGMRREELLVLVNLITKKILE